MSAPTGVEVETRDASGPVAAVIEAVERESATYANGADRPLGGYLFVVATYLTATAAGIAVLRHRRRTLPSSIPVRDVAFMSVATFQLARLITKKPITSVLRAPFTEFEGTGAPAELKERARGHGIRHALGELMTCPFCVAHWIVTGFGFSYVASPDVARLAATMLTAEAVADFLQYGHAAISDRSGAKHG
jgi:hypothetical protein